MTYFIIIQIYYYYAKNAKLMLLFEWFKYFTSLVFIVAGDIPIYNNNMNIQQLIPLNIKNT